MKRLSVGCAALSASLLIAFALNRPPVDAAAPEPAVKAVDAPVPPHLAAARMTLPAGFRATLFAGEPDLVQPIAMTTDDRGRLWVVENHSYPQWVTSGEGKDRILIFEDGDGDGTFDKRTVFFDRGTNLSGIAVGFGGVWLCGTPNFTFIPDRNNDDKPDGPPQVLIDGWDMKSKHNVTSSLGWGPDGWLYACNGILGNSKIGKPGTPDDKRIAFNCGVWRYHPVRHEFETVAWGTTNPWGLDWDDHGRAYITNCVIKHLWHVVPGAHFERMYGRDLNPNVYGLIESVADHIHWAGGRWQDSRGNKPEHDKTGGGHAHAGCLVYTGDTWPAEYRNNVFTCNIHGARVNRDIPKPRGSSVVAEHGPDFLFANDPWFRGLGLTAAHDGAVYVSDWCDSGECHDYDHADRTNGRIYKVQYGDVKVKPPSLRDKLDVELVELHTHRNDWFVRQARRLLQERAARNELCDACREGLLKMARTAPEVVHRLRALWTLYAIGSFDEALAAELLADRAEHVRAWVIRLEADDRKASPKQLERFAELAKSDPSPVVRLELASAMQRIPVADRTAIARGLLSHAVDASDAYLPLMIWYGLEPAVTLDVGAAVALAAESKIPLIRRHVAHRAVEADLANLPAVITGLASATVDADRLDVLLGLHDALLGRRKVDLPAGWTQVYPKLAGSADAEVRRRAVALALTFGDADALASLRRTVVDRAAPVERRREALSAVLLAKPAGLGADVRPLLDEPAMRGPAIRALAALGEPGTPGLLLASYKNWSDSDKADAVDTLASRPAFATALLAAVEAGTVARTDISPFVARQIAQLKDPKLVAALNRVWGTLRPASAEKAAQMTRWKKLLTADSLAKADLADGKQVYTKTCASCHVLFGEGGKIGPELTGAQRTNLDYILENALDPSAVVGRDYQVTLIRTQDGRLLNGIVKQETDAAVVLQMPNEQVVIPKGEIDERKLTGQSMMPEGQFDKLTPDQVRNLVAYLASNGGR